MAIVASVVHRKTNTLRVFLSFPGSRSVAERTARDRLASANPLGEPGHNERPDYPCTFEHYVDKRLNLVCLGQESGIADYGLVKVSAGKVRRSPGYVPG